MSIHYNTRQRRFEYKLSRTSKVTLRGVYTSLKERAWPQYDFKKAKYGAPPPEYQAEARRSMDETSTAQRQRQANASARIRTGAQGQKQGTRVDKQMTEIAAYLRQYHKAPHKLELQHFVDMQTRVPWSIPKRQELLAFRRKLHPYTIRLVHFLIRQKWMPITGQLAVGCPRLRIGTAVDLICKDTQTNEYIVVELKCGFDRYYFHHTGKNMTRPFTNVQDSPYFQHQMQLAVTTWLYAFRTPHKLKCRSCVLRIHKTGVSHYPLRDDFRIPFFFKKIAVLLR